MRDAGRALHAVSARRGVPRPARRKPAKVELKPGARRLTDYYRGAVEGERRIGTGRGAHAGSTGTRRVPRRRSHIAVSAITALRLTRAGDDDGGFCFPSDRARDRCVPAANAIVAQRRKTCDSHQVKFHAPAAKPTADQPPAAGHVMQSCNAEKPLSCQKTHKLIMRRRRALSLRQNERRDSAEFLHDTASNNSAVLPVHAWIRADSLSRLCPDSIPRSV